MKLSKRINYIIFPIISVIFIAAGIISYYSQKSIVLESLQDKVGNHATHIVEELTDELLETDSLLKQFLNSVEVTNYLVKQASTYQIYTTESQLIRFISSVNKNTGKEIQLRISDQQGKNIFFFDSSDPFASSENPVALKSHLDFIESQLDDEHSNIVTTTSYNLQQISDDEFKLNVLKTFSPEQSIYDNSFSRNSTLYTATMSVPFRISARFVPSVRANFSEKSQLALLGKTSIVDINHLKKISFTATSGEKMSAENDLIKATITLPQSYIQTLLFPYRLAIVSLVLNVTLICFYLLRLLIQRQIIVPIERLTQQVEKALLGDERALKVVASDDEVSSLNNNYIKLLEDLNTLARRDPLTGLANRSVFSASLVRTIQDAIDTSTMCALYFIDLDNFKQVNDTYGHQVGDRLLVEFAKQLSMCFRKEDIIVKPSAYSDVARIAGDEFAVVLPHPPNIDTISSVAQRIVDICRDGIWVDGQRLDVHVSVGIAVSPNDAQDADTLMRYADSAMYQLKRSGKNGYNFYSDELEEELRQHSRIEEAIREALANEGFHLNFMPIYACGSLEIVGLEVLIRAQHPLLKAIGPEQFIPVAEHSGLIGEIDLWVIEHSFTCMRELIDKLHFTGKIAINFSSWELNNDKFAVMVEALLNRYKIPPSQVELEITETCLVSNNTRTIARLSELKELGVSLSLDDFGTGYTAFSQLQHFPVDSLKVDRSFVWAISDETKTTRPLVDIIIELASLYKLNVVAEGVESQAQLDYVTELGCDEVQGYFLSKPIDWQSLVRLLAK